MYLTVHLKSTPFRQSNSIAAIASAMLASVAAVVAAITAECSISRTAKSTTSSVATCWRTVTTRTLFAGSLG